MRVIILFRMCFCFVIALPGACDTAYGQIGAHEPSQISMGASQMYSMMDPYWKANTTKAATTWESLSGVSGTIFFNDDWSDGYVMLQDKKRTPEIALRYNIYTNEIFFKQDSLVMVIDPSLPVREFGLKVNGAEKRYIVFRNGYPASDKNASNTFYQVIADGPLSVLKHYTKRVTIRNNMTTGPEKVINDTEDWYLYDSAANTITSFKPSKTGIVEALPRYAATVRMIIREKGLTLQKDEDWVGLLDRLTIAIKSKDPARN